MDLGDVWEKEGREKVWEIISGHTADIEWTKFKYDPLDAYLTSKKGEKVCMEIKLRRYTSEFLNEKGGYMLEKDKWINLNNAKGYKPLYVMVMPDETLFFDVSKITEDRFVYEEQKYHKKTKVESDLIDKWVCYLQRDEAISKKKTPQNE